MNCLRILECCKETRMKMGTIESPNRSLWTCCRSPRPGSAWHTLWHDSTVHFSMPHPWCIPHYCCHIGLRPLGLPILAAFLVDHPRFFHFHKSFWYASPFPHCSMSCAWQAVTALTSLGVDVEAALDYGRSLSVCWRGRLCTSLHWFWGNFKIL